MRFLNHVSRKKSWVSIGIILAGMTYASPAGAQYSNYYNHTPNAAISGHNNKTLTGKTVQQCKTACEFETGFVCQSFDYYKTEKKCDLSAESEKTKSLKKNYAGNPYDHYSRYAFKYVRNAAISGHNKRKLSGVKPSQCQKACAEETSFVCKSIDYKKTDGSCDLSDKSASDVGGLKRDYPNNPYDHYELAAKPTKLRKPSPAVVAARKPANNIGAIDPINKFVIESKIDGKYCGFEADADKGEPGTLGDQERLAKWDCKTSWRESFFRKGKGIYMKSGMETCGLQYDADAGEVSSEFQDFFDQEIGDNEHLAKFDCEKSASNMIFEGNRIYTMIKGKKCGLEWNADKGDLATISAHEHIAKFDCGGSADPVRFKTRGTQPEGIKTFQMAFASDPQDDYCESSFCETNPGSSATANRWQSSSILKLKNASSKFMGVVVNGDLTHTMEDEQRDNYHNNYAKKFRVFSGLGNHDYENYVKGDSKWCREGMNATAKHRCAKDMVDYLVNEVKDNEFVKGFDYAERGAWIRRGSLAYHWDIGDYRFIQLNNHPDYEVDFDVYIPTRVGSEEYKIFKGWWYLEKVLGYPDSANKNIILNMHEMLSAEAMGYQTDADDFYLKDGNNNRIADPDLEKLKDILLANPNIKAVFAGHLHNRAGQYYRTGENAWTALALEDSHIRLSNGRTVPVLFGGGAEYNHYIDVKFNPNGFAAEVIDSIDGKLTRTGKTTAVNW